MKHFIPLKPKALISVYHENSGQVAFSGTKTTGFLEIQIYQYEVFQTKILQGVAEAFV